MFQSKIIGKTGVAVRRLAALVLAGGLFLTATAVPVSAQTWRTRALCCHDIQPGRRSTKENEMSKGVEVKEAARRFGALSRVGRALALTVGIAVLSLNGAAATKAATVTTGLHFTSEVDCKSLHTSLGLTAIAPLMHASQATLAGNVSVVGPNHMQWVGFRQILKRWNQVTRTWANTDQNRDGLADAGPIFQARVGNDASYVPIEGWYNTSSKRYESGGTVFPVRDAGYYRVATKYWWYADAFTGAGYDYLWAGPYLHNTYGLQSSPWCEYR